jgi:glycine betaine/proline transport system permease protein
MALATASPDSPTFGVSTIPRWVIPAVVFVGLCALAIAVNPNVPSWLDIGFQRWIRDRYMWTVQNSTTHWVFTRVFNPLADAIDSAISAVHWVLVHLRWPGVVTLTCAIGWRTGGIRAGITGAMAMLGVAVLGVWEPAMVTLSLMITAVVIALCIGVPLGIWTSRSDHAERVIRGVLDTAQVMPVFVYLIPVSVFFGLQGPPAVVATVIYAVPPAVRLTNLGLRSVPVVTNEVAESFGCTPFQQLVKVQLPMARRTILLGLNQVIMMAFGVVVIASLLGANDLGQLVLRGLQKNDVGAAFVPGLAIVLLAVSLDRITTGERPTSVRQRSWMPDISHRTASIVAVGSVVIATALAAIFSADSFPTSLTIDISGGINDAVDWVQRNLRHGVPIIGGTQAINDFLVADVLEPIRAFLVWLPWLTVVLFVAAVAYASKGWRLAVGCAACLLAIGTMGSIPGGVGGRTHMWDLAMDTLSQVLVAIVIIVLIALPLRSGPGAPATAARRRAGDAAVRVPDPGGVPVRARAWGRSGRVGDLCDSALHPPHQPRPARGAVHAA